MIKNINYIIITFSFITMLMSSSLVKSAFMPGWGEANEFKLLSKDKEPNEIKYINKRSNSLMLTEAAIWIGFFLSDDFSKSYKNDYENYGISYAGVNWIGKTELYAAHVGNYNSMLEYNEEIIRTQVSSINVYKENAGFDWDWKGNKSLRLKYDDMRNKSGELDELKSVMIAALAINRIISFIDVMIIKRKHGRSFSIDLYEEKENMQSGFKVNYHF